MSLINHIGISGGKDSTALLLWAVYESGYPKESIVATFCDTGNEHHLTYEYIQMLHEKVYPIITIKPALDFWELAKKKGRFPSTKARFCTQELKMIPTKLFIDELLRGGYEVRNHSGVRRQESLERSNLPEWDDAMFSYYGVPTFRPLLYWTIDAVWVTHWAYGIEPNPLYAMGAKRVGCFPCIMSQKSEIRMIAKKSPETIDNIRLHEIELKSTFFSRNKVPEIFRSKPVEVAVCEEFIDDRTGVLKRLKTSEKKILYVPTIDDVVDWSMTGKGGHNYELDFEEDINFDEHLSTCQIGICE